MHISTAVIYIYPQKLYFNISKKAALWGLDLLLNQYLQLNRAASQSPLLSNDYWRLYLQEQTCETLFLFNEMWCNRVSCISLTNQNPFCGSTKKSFIDVWSSSIALPIKINELVFGELCIKIQLPNKMGNIIIFKEFMDVLAFLLS
jgi:hypothetical protein